MYCRIHKNALLEGRKAEATTDIGVKLVEDLYRILSFRIIARCSSLVHTESRVAKLTLLRQ
jgi:hypothetical protein